MRSAVLIFSVALLVVSSSVSPGIALEADREPPAQVAESPIAEDFGYGSMTVDGEAARGVRPLLVVVVESPPVANKSGIAHDVSYYDSLVFGYGDDGLPANDGSGRNVSIDELFIENSRGKFSWSKAGGKIYGPITYPSSEAFVSEGGFEDGEFDSRTAAPHLVADRGFDFARYDTDGDGTVSRDELGILVFDDRSTGGGQTIPICEKVDTPDGGKIRVCTAASGVGHRSSLSVVAHELGHQLGAPHFYGADTRLKSRTIMGPSTGPDNLWTFHFDPWNKIQLGWARPQRYSIPELQDGGQCAYPGRLGGSGLLSDRDTRTPVIIYDPERYDTETRTGEYYVMEYRESTSYDSNLQYGPGGSGLAIWYVQTENGWPKALPALIRGDGPSAFDTGSLDSTPAGDDVRRGDRIYPGPNGTIDTTVPRGPDGEALDVDPIPTDVMNFLVAPGAPEQGAPWNYSQRGNYPFWSTTDDDARLRWFDDSYVGVPLKLEWEYREGPVVNLNTREMHIDAGLARTVTAEPGGEVTLYGHFVPESRGPVVRITRDGETVAELDRAGAGIGRWNCDEISVHLPVDLDYGEYELYASDPTTGTRSDRIALRVSADVDYESWFGTYDGRLDGRDAELTVEPGSEFDVELELRDLERDVTYRGTTTGSTSNVLRDVTLRSDSGSTKTIDALYLQGDGRLSGHTEWRRDAYGFAFSEDAAEWDPSGEALSSRRAKWSTQWLGRYDGYVDDDGADLRILDVEFAGLGYVYDVELVDGDGAVYRGRGSVLLDSPHVMRFGRPLVNTTTVSLGGDGSDLDSTPGSGAEAIAVVDSVRLPRLLLHTWDTEYVSGWVTSSRYGSGGVGAYFVRTEGDEIPPYVGDLVERYNANAGRAPESARAVFANQRIDLVVTSTAHPVVREDRAGAATRARTETEEVYGLVTGDPAIERVQAGGLSNPTMTVRVRRDHVDAIVESDDPGGTFVEYYRRGVIAVEPASLGTRVTFGVGGVVSNLARRFGDDGGRYPSQVVRRLAGYGGLSRNAGLVRRSRVVRVADDVPVAGHEDVGGLKDELRRDGGGASRYLRLVQGGAAVADEVRHSR